MESDTSCYTLVMPLECAGNASVCKGGFNPSHAKSLAHRITEYTRRDLSFQSDALNAMQGIFRAFAALPSPTRHFWGIPMDIWPADKPGYPRGSAGKLCSEESFARSLYWFLKEPSHRREGFPTWSWAGWKGKISDSFHAPGWSLGLQRSDESCDIKVWLGRTDGTYGRLTDSIAEEAYHLTTGFAPVFRMEAWISTVRFEYLDPGRVDIPSSSNNPRQARYFVSAPAVRDDAESPSVIRWLVTLCILPTTDNGYHDKLCREEFDCIWLSMGSFRGLVVSRTGGFAERVGHIDTKKPHLQPEPARETEPNPNSWASYRARHIDSLLHGFPPERRTLLMR